MMDQLLGEVFGYLFWGLLIFLYFSGIYFLEKIQASQKRKAIQQKIQERDEENRQNPSWVLEQTKEKLPRTLPLIKAHAQDHLAWVRQINNILTYLATRISEVEQAASSGPLAPAQYDVGFEVSNLAKQEAEQLDSYRRMTRFLYDLIKALPKAAWAAREGNVTPMERAQAKFEQACQEWLTQRDRVDLNIADSSHLDFQSSYGEDERNSIEAVLVAEGIKTQPWEMREEADEDGPDPHRPARLRQRQHN